MWFFFNALPPLVKCGILITASPFWIDYISSRLVNLNAGLEPPLQWGGKNHQLHMVRRDSVRLYFESPFSYSNVICISNALVVLYDIHGKEREWWILLFHHHRKKNYIVWVSPNLWNDTIILINICL